MSRAARAVTANGETLALVPTMGYLHDGHLALVDRARKTADRTVVSIFVNPTQFGPGEDFTSYPRNRRRDLQLLCERDVDFVYLPKPTNVYPKDYATFVEVEGLTDTLEGAVRPRHFRGVTTIVAKLFNICRPDVVVFGQKDYQQALVLRKMTRDLNYPIRFIIAPTVREKDGLALSSRNSYFTPAQRAEAVCLFRGLSAARSAFVKGERSAAKLIALVKKEARRACRTVAFDYVALTDFHTLKSLKTAKKGAVISTAARVHKVRLIDNIRL